MNVRPPEEADLEAVLEVLRAADAAVAGDSDWTASDLANEWRELDLPRDAWVFEVDGTVAGYASFYARGGRLSGDGYVHPETVALGERVYLQNATLNVDACTERFYRDHGYEPVRGFRGMTIELEEPPDVPELPGIVIRPYDHPAEAKAFHAAQQESFETHWEHRPTPWEEWEQRRFGRETFDPTLWWVAVDGAEIAGVAMCEQKRNPDQGWVDVLGVRPAYRRRGIAEALLKTVFAEFFRRGERRVGLGVDAESPTGATRVYERAGMRTLWQAVVWEKELRLA